MIKGCDGDVKLEDLFIFLTLRKLWLPALLSADAFAQNGR